jgi:hypothetical protein
MTTKTTGHAGQDARLAKQIEDGKTCGVCANRDSEGVCRVRQYRKTPYHEWEPFFVDNADTCFQWKDPNPPKRERPTGGRGAFAEEQDEARLEEWWRIYG